MSKVNNHDHQHDEHCNCVATGSTVQTLDELDFQRGIWTAVINGDIARVRMFLNERKLDPNIQDTSSYTSQNV